MSSNICLSSRRSQLQNSYLEISRFIRRHLAERYTSQPVRKYIRRTRSEFHTTANSLTTPSSVPSRRRSPLQAHEVRGTFQPSCRRLFSLAGWKFGQNQYQHDLAALHSFEKASEANLAATDGWQRLNNWPNISKTKENGLSIRLTGYITSQRPVKGITFVQLVDPSLQQGVQLVCSDTEAKLSNPSGEELDKAQSSWKPLLKSLHPHTPVLVTGRVVEKKQKSKNENEAVSSKETLDLSVGNIALLKQVEVHIESVQQLNQFDNQIDTRSGVSLPPEQRHLAFRTNHLMRERLRFRSKLRSQLQKQFEANGFQEIETPILFKSTPEGAREYIVPTRHKGLAYALPQSPQQYKQILMASGIPRYFQFARCFRDEDLRSDRQPEFTQLDLEMAFADSKAVMQVVEDLVLKIMWPMSGRQQRLDPKLLSSVEESSQNDTILLPILTYQEAMTKYGSDKPDTRIGSEIHRVEDWLPSNLKGMLSSLEKPVVEMILVSMNGSTPSESRQLLSQFMKLPASAQYNTNPEGMPGIFVYDPMSPISGLASFGHEAAERIEQTFQPEPGDVLIAQTRVDKPFSGGSTMLGKMRQHLHLYSVQKGLRDEPDYDALLWVVDFPLFSPIEQDSPGQGGAAGICSTHHPFTAPKPGQNPQKIIDDPLGVMGDHYDLVINGVEVGGGSRRIHHREMQEVIFRSVLQMSEERISDFEHLLNALQSGCPPHAGFALGFDRVVALLKDAESVRDVIAFPKYKDGRDLFVGSPSELTPCQLATYHLSLAEDGAEAREEPRLSMKA